ncbi:MAG: sulfite oxidase-like oxidoreductase [Thermoprotei archaeon]|nr:MAG: sulfite oxidase-like oxidoreductase [Thermoprotei archaeon]
MNEIIYILCTIDENILKYLSPNRKERLLENYQPPYPIKSSKSIISASHNTPPGQRIIPNFIIYRILGQPKVNLNLWRLKISGLVKRKLELSYDELLSMPLKAIVSDFHCVTGWSVKSIKWEGIPLKYLAMKAEVLKSAKWVYVESLDGYTTIIPIADFLNENSLLVIKINDKPLSIEQGFPARIFVPHLYGWKSAKWVTQLRFINHYEDGFWEALGYHERGNVWLDERFKALIIIRKKEH